MPDTKQQLDRFAAGHVARPLPKPPTVPDEVKDKFPSLKDAWNKHDENWRQWTRKQQTIGP